MVSFTSTAGTGSVFSFYLPAIEEQQKTRGKGKKNAVEGRVLLMDDDEFILDAFADMIISLGYSVKTVKDGNEALSVIR